MTRKLKIVCDDKIPYIGRALEELASEVVFLPGKAISPVDVRDAQALIVRTRTRVDRDLIGGSNVEFVATATIGFDHLDTAWLNQAGIRWMNCPGCNAGSVEQYVRSALFRLQELQGLQPHVSTLGIVGCGHVGSRVLRTARRMGFSRILVCDPSPHAAAHDLLSERGIEWSAQTTPLDIAGQADVVTFHVPLNREGPLRTWHMADAAFFNACLHRPFIINTSRGEVVDTQALLRALEAGQARQAVIDVWENEPAISTALLNKVFIGTPHIAGYSADGKCNADNMVIEGLCRHFNIVNRWNILPPQGKPAELPAAGPADWQARSLALYDPLEDSRLLKAAPERFECLRSDYRVRREH